MGLQATWSRHIGSCRFPPEQQAAARSGRRVREFGSRWQPLTLELRVLDIKGVALVNCGSGVWGSTQWQIRTASVLGVSLERSPRKNSAIGKLSWSGRCRSAPMAVSTSPESVPPPLCVVPVPTAGSEPTPWSACGLMQWRRRLVNVSCAERVERLISPPKSRRRQPACPPRTRRRPAAARSPILSNTSRSPRSPMRRRPFSRRSAS